jgi:predicted  nucleic acid-binding Zn-ribbon protein
MIEAAGQDGDEVARLRMLVAEQAAALKTAQAEAAAAKAGLIAKSLEIEKLKIQGYERHRGCLAQSDWRFS